MRPATLALPLVAAALLLAGCSGSHSTSASASSAPSSSAPAAPSPSPTPAAPSAASPSVTAPAASTSASAVASELLAALAPVTSQLSSAQRTQLDHQVRSLSDGSDQAEVTQLCSALKGNAFERAAAEAVLRQRLTAAGASLSGSQMDTLVGAARSSLCTG